MRRSNTQRREQRHVTFAVNTNRSWTNIVLTIAAIVAAIFVTVKLYALL